MKIKSYFILLISILLISTAIFSVRVPVAHGICKWSLARVVGVLEKVIRNGGGAEEIGRVIRQIQTYATVCDEGGNAISGIPYPTDSLSPQPTRGAGTPVPTLGPIGGSSNAKAFGYASQISPLIDPCKMWSYNGYCRHVNTVNGNGIESRYREGLNDGFGTSTTGRYWCATYTEDIVRMALGSSINITESVIGQTSAWKSNGFPYFPYYEGGQEQSILQTIQPGCLMFQMESVTVHQAGNQHVAVVKSVDLNAYGDGTVRTLDANGPVRESQYTVEAWKFYRMVNGKPVKINSWMHTNVAFGCLP